MKLLSLLKRKPKPPEPEPVWVGECSCCHRVIKAYNSPPDADEDPICLACAFEATPQSRERAAERKQIDLIKQALREYEEEKTQNQNENTDTSA